MSKKILFPDNIHFHDRGFKSLMDLIKTNDFEAIFIKEYNNLKSMYGDYREVKSVLLNYYDQLFNLNEEELFNKTHLAISLFNLLKAELLSLLMTKENWYGVDVSSDDIWIFNKAFQENKEDLLLNMSIVMFWLDFWQKILAQNKKLDFCVIFSGSLIYVKTLSYLCQNTPIKVFIVEHFFTGNDFYFEEKYTHIANNSDIKFKNYYNKLLKEFDEEELLVQKKEPIKALNKYILKNNKNVKQPNKDNTKIEFKDEHSTLLILGQVINDFSILETKLNNINSIQVYKKIIKNVLKETSYNIIFKAHPWENKKVNLNRSLTKEVLIEFISNFSEKDRKRVVIVEEYNLEELILSTDIVCAFCSQSLLEAAYLGRKTMQFGNAFFGKKGFTFDFNNENEFIEYIIKTDNIECDLTLQEYTKLLDFFTIIFQKHLISTNPSGKSSLIKKLEKIQFVNVVNEISKTNLSPSIKTTPLAKEREVYHIEEIDNRIKNETFKRKLIENIVLSISSEKKAIKFNSHPKQFFSDSQYFIVRLLGKIY